MNSRRTIEWERSLARCSGAPAFGSKDAHIWKIDLDVESEGSFLSNDEHERAEKFAFAVDRNRFIAGRSALRTILGGYLQCDPGRVEIETAEGGRPRLRHGAFAYNFTRAQRFGFAIVGACEPLGVDAECDRGAPDRDQIVAEFFSQAEQVEYQSNGEQTRPSAFYAGWTRKEAVLKALGYGLNAPLSDFDVSLNSDAPGVVLGARGTVAAAKNLRLHDFWAAPDCYLCAATGTIVKKLSFFELISS